MQRVRMQQTMPEDRTGWHLINAGPDIEILFHPDRRPVGREPDQIERAYREIGHKRRVTRHLHLPPFLIEPVDEIDAVSGSAIG